MGELMNKYLLDWIIEYTSYDNCFEHSFCWHDVDWRKFQLELREMILAWESHKQKGSAQVTHDDLMDKLRSAYATTCANRLEGYEEVKGVDIDG